MYAFFICCINLNSSEEWSAEIESLAEEVMCGLVNIVAHVHLITRRIKFIVVNYPPMRPKVSDRCCLVPRVFAGFSGFAPSTKISKFQLDQDRGQI